MLKNLNKFVSLAFSILVLGCSTNSFSSLASDNIDNTTNIQSTQEKAKWTVMVYMAGDNDLEEYIVKDLEKELGAIGSTKNIQVVALADRIAGYDTSKGNWADTRLFHVPKGLVAFPENALADWGERNFGDPKTLVDFVTWSKNNYPAEKYALYFWGHGWNWHQGFTMEDTTNKDSLDPDEVKASLPKLGDIDMVAYDGCNMASIEVDALWHKKAKAIVHSQEYVGWDGIEYDVVLKKLNENPNITPEELAIVTNKSASMNKEKTGSAIVLDQRFDKLLKDVSDWSIALKNGLSKNKKSYDLAFKKSQHFIDAPDEKDLYHLAKNMKENVNDSVIKEKSQNVMDSLKAVVLDEWHLKEYPNANGLTISKVPAKDKQKAFYKTIDFSKNTQWDEFLDVYKD
jgi:hypothetical protein